MAGFTGFSYLYKDVNACEFLLSAKASLGREIGLQVF
jgi:hypothetical protein